MAGPSVEDRGICVLVLSDPGQCSTRALAVQELFEQELSRVFGSASVEVRPQFFGVSDTRTLDFRPIDSLREEFTRVDTVLLLTEMPRLSHGRPEIAKLFPDERAASLSYPTLGVLAGGAAAGRAVHVLRAPARGRRARGGAVRASREPVDRPEGDYPARRPKDEDDR